MQYWNCVTWWSATGKNNNSSGKISTCDNAYITHTRNLE